MTAETSRHAATQAMVRYFVLAFVVVGLLGSLLVYSFFDSRSQRRETLAIRVAYCQELEKLKTDNREDLARSKKNYARNLRLLHLQDSPELRRAAEEGWKRKAMRNAPKSCPYKG